MQPRRDSDDPNALGGWIIALAVLGVVFLLMPIVITVVVSFNDTRYFAFPPEQWSLRWYNRFLGSRPWMRSLWLSVEIASMTAVLATGLGLMASLALVRGTFRGKAVVLSFLLSPLIVPHIIIAIGLYFFFVRLGLHGSSVAIALGHTVLALPVTMIILSATLQGIDSRLEHVAKSLGASSFYTLRRITLPLIAPGLASSALFAFLTSFDELLIPLFLSNIRSQTLSVRIWHSLEIDVDPTLTAVSSVLIGASAVVLALHLLIKSRTARRA